MSDTDTLPDGRCCYEFNTHTLIQISLTTDAVTTHINLLKVIINDTRCNNSEVDAKNMNSYNIEIDHFNNSTIEEAKETPV